MIPQSPAYMDPGGMIDKIYKLNVTYYASLETKNSMAHGFRQEVFWLLTL